MTRSSKTPADTTTLRTVDLFCGCGGLTLGFELHRGEVRFETVLAADIDASALKVFNQNFRGGAQTETGRIADLSWFSHRAEVLLYFLAHLALWRPDEDLRSALNEMGFDRFLSEIRAVDARFMLETAALVDMSDYKEAWAQVDSKVTSLALYRGAMTKLGIRSLTRAELDGPAMPWTEEVSLFGTSRASEPADAHEALLSSAASIWDDQVHKFTDAATKNGRGQHRTVAARMATLIGFLGSAPALALRDAWVRWRAQRDSIRATFCLGSEARLDALYDGSRRVHLVLGGPPCKGWSRIGRAVIESLRDQGVHAWACKEYGDERNALLHKYVLFLDALRPTAFLFENVAHFRSSLRTPDGSVNAASILEASINDLASSDLDFHVESKIVRARQHGVPQDRERFIMVGIRGNGMSATWLRQFFHAIPQYKQEVPLSMALLGLEAPGDFHPYERAVSCSTSHQVAAYTLIDESMPAPVRHYLAWVRQPRLNGGVAPRTTDAHIVRVAREDDFGLYRYIAPGMRWMDYKFDGMPTLKELQQLLEAVVSRQRASPVDGLPDAKAVQHLQRKLDGSLVLRLLLEAIDPPTGKSAGHHLLQNGYLAKGTDHHGDWLERLSPDRPCKTVVAHIGKDTYGYIHPYEPRALSIREAARVQSFPDFFALGGVGVVDTYGMIGNAVPPLVAAHFAKSFEVLHQQHGLFGDGSRAATPTDHRRKAEAPKREAQAVAP